MNQHGVCSRINIKFCFKLTFCSFIFCIVALIYLRKYYYVEEQLKTYNNFGFYPVNDQGVYSFWNVCIEDTGFNKQSSFQGYEYKETQRIAVYNSFYRIGDQQLNVAASSNSELRTWDLKFFRRPIPSTHTFHKVTAFFIIPTCPRNFHHFWIDHFVSLFNVVWRGNRLKPNSGNRVFYPGHGYINNTDNCYDVNRFKKFLDPLYLGSKPSVFYNAPTNSCYSSAVFGANTVNLKNPRFIINHTLSYFLKNSDEYKQILKTKPCSVVIFNREYRKIINIDELISAAKSMGLGEVCKVSFEKISFEEQLSVASRAHMMVGVQGAGLQWAVFMPDKSVLVEVGWPQKHWGFYYSGIVKAYGIQHVQLVTQNVQVNWSSYEKNVRKGVVVGVDERLEILAGSGVKNQNDNLWKWADVVVDVASFKDILSSFV